MIILFTQIHSNETSEVFNLVLKHANVIVGFQNIFRKDLKDKDFRKV